jgi:hypothetical protein
MFACMYVCMIYVSIFIINTLTSNENSLYICMYAFELIIFTFKTTYYHV